MTQRTTSATRVPEARSQATAGGDPVAWTLVKGPAGMSLDKFLGSKRPV